MPRFPKEDKTLFKIGLCGYVVAQVARYISQIVKRCADTAAVVNLPLQNQTLFIIGSCSPGIALI